MKNEYEIRGATTAIFINSNKYGRMEALISTEKLERAKEIQGSWYVNLCNNTNYFYVKSIVNVPGVGQRTIRLHRFIIGAGEKLVVDHINHDTLNNTDENLRITTNSENQQNRKGPQKNNRSGVRGVYWEKTQCKWRAHFKKDGKRVHVGYFDSIEEAEKEVAIARARHMPFSKEASA